MNKLTIKRSLLRRLTLVLGLILIGSISPTAANEATEPGPGTLLIVAGTGRTGFEGDKGPATMARLAAPIGLAVDPQSNLYIADFNNHRVRRVDTDGTITTFAGTGRPGYSGDNGPAAEARLNHPDYVACDAAGNIYIAEVDGHRIRKVSPDGIITTIAGTGKPAKAGIDDIGDGGLAIQADLDEPHGLALDREGNLFIAESYVHRIRKVSPNGIITTVAGIGYQGFSGDGSPATQAMLNLPNGLATDAAGNLYFAESGDIFNPKLGSRVRKVSTDGMITTVAGLGPRGFSGDNGPATEAQLDQPFSVAVDSAGNLFITDRGNALVRKVTPNGIITTVAGGGTATPTSEGAPATSVALRQALTGVAVDVAGNLYFAESSLLAAGRDRVYKVVKVAAPGLIGSQPLPEPER